MKRTIKSAFSPLGIIGWVIVLQRYIFQFIGWVGDLDFISQNWPMIIKFFDSGLGTLTSTIVGCLIVGTAILRARTPENSVQIPTTGSLQGPKRQAGPIQTEAISDDNPNGTWIYPEPEKFDFSPYDPLNQLTLMGAACLWAEQVPVGHPMHMKTKTLPRYQLLSDAMKEKKLSGYISAARGSGPPG